MKQELSSYMVKGPFVCDPKTKLNEAIDLMRQLDFRHLPVVEGGKLTGIVSERDLREALIYPKASGLLVEDVMKRTVYAVKRDTPLKLVAREMAGLKFGSAVVIGEDDEVIGIFTTTDALRILADILDDDDAAEYYMSEDFYESWVPIKEVSV